MVEMQTHAQRSALLLAWHSRLLLPGGKGISLKCLTEVCSPLAKAKQHLTSDEISE